MTKREWNPPWPVELIFRRAPYGFPRLILLLLLDDDKTYLDFLQAFARFIRPFGYFQREEEAAGFTEETYLAAVQKALREMEQEGVIAQHGARSELTEGGTYSLTPAGRLRAERMQRGFQSWGWFFRRLLHPQTVALVGLGVHIILAVLKLVAGAISGSIGLMSDGLDTAMDGLSSVLVFVGLRLNKEKYVNVVLVLLMLGVGIGAGYGAVRRIFEPVEPEVDLLTFAAAILSGLVCLLLSVYQQHVATRSGQLALISQAVDSRNHAIVAAGVTVGLVSVLLHFPLLDTLVGLAVAALVLKSGVELALETMRSLRGEEVDLSRYELDFVESYRRYHQRQLADWLLSVIAGEGLVLSEVEEGPLTRRALLALCQEELDVGDIPILREFSFLQGIEWHEELASNGLETLIEQGFVTADETGELQVTEKGQAELNPE